MDVNLSVDTKFLVDEAGNLLPGVAKSVAKAIGKVIGLIPGLGGKDDFADVTAGLRFGLWGYCFSGLGFECVIFFFLSLRRKMLIITLLIVSYHISTNIPMALAKTPVLVFTSIRLWPRFCQCNII